MRRWLAFAFGAAALACAGCAGGPRSAPRSAPASGTREEAIRFFESRKEQIKTIHAGVELHWISSELDGPLSCSASLVFKAPSHLRLRGTSKAFFTIFDLIAGPEEITIDIPREKVLIRGERNDPQWSQFALDPDLVTIALLAHPDPFGNEALEIREEGKDFVWEGEGARLVLDGATGRPSCFRREEPRAEVIWEEWNEARGIPWARHVRLAWPELGDTLEIDFGRVQPGKPVREDYFDELPEDDREILTPGEGIERWAEMLEREAGASGPE